MVELTTSLTAMPEINADATMVPATLVHEGELLPKINEEGCLKEVQSSDPLPAESNGQGLSFLLNHRGILFAILVSFGPLGLPLICMSPRFSVWSKVAISTVTLGITVVFPIAMTLYWADYALQPLLEAMQQANATH